MKDDILQAANKDSSGKDEVEIFLGIEMNDLRYVAVLFTI